MVKKQQEVQANGSATGLSWEGSCADSRLGRRWLVEFGNTRSWRCYQNVQFSAGLVTAAVGGVTKPLGSLGLFGAAVGGEWRGRGGPAPNNPSEDSHLLLGDSRVFRVVFLLLTPMSFLPMQLTRLTALVIPFLFLLSGTATAGIYIEGDWQNDSW